MTNVNMPIILKMGQTNCYLLKCRDGYMAIDTSFPTFYGKYVEGLKKIDIDPSEIKYLLLTHHHDDHAGFAAELKEKTGCKIIAHKNSVDMLKSGSMLFMNKPLNRRVEVTMAVFNKLKKRRFTIRPVTLGENDIIVDGENNDVLRQIGIDGKIIHTPGHTIDSISVILDNGDAFVGDICMNFLNFCSIHYRPIWLYNPGLVFESWGKIIESGAREVYPAHGKPFAVDRLVHYKKLYSAGAKQSS